MLAYIAAEQLPVHLRLQALLTETIAQLVTAENCRYRLEVIVQEFPQGAGFHSLLERAEDHVAMVSNCDRSGQEVNICTDTKGRHHHIVLNVSHCFHPCIMIINCCMRNR